MYWLAFPALLFMWLLKEFSDKDTWIIIKEWIFEGKTLKKRKEEMEESIKSCDLVLNKYYKNHEQIIKNHSHNFKIAEGTAKREREKYD